jgi:hypothetical protein
MLCALCSMLYALCSICSLHVLPRPPVGASVFFEGKKKNGFVCCFYLWCVGMFFVCSYLAYIPAHSSPNKVTIRSDHLTGAHTHGRPGASLWGHEGTPVDIHGARSTIHNASKETERSSAQLLRLGRVWQPTGVLFSPSLGLLSEETRFCITDRSSRPNPPTYPITGHCEHLGARTISARTANSQ